MVKKIALLFDEKKAYILETIEKAVLVLSGCGMQIFISSKIKNQIKDRSVIFFDNVYDIIPSVDMVVAFGGDGSIIYFSKLCAGFNKPVLGVNTGKIGFLSGIERCEVDKLRRLSENKCIIENHFLLETEYDGKIFLALNELVISRKPVSRMLDFEIYKSGKKISSFRADGVIVSTPTGSTAYSFSAGGPIIDNEVNCFAVTPICPHEISCKCMILPCDQEILIKTEGEAVLNADGSRDFANINSEFIKIKKSGLIAKFVKFSKNCLYENIEKKILKRR